MSVPLGFIHPPVSAVAAILGGSPGHKAESISTRVDEIPEGRRRVILEAGALLLSSNGEGSCGAGRERRKQGTIARRALGVPGGGYGRDGGRCAHVRVPLAGWKGRAGRVPL